MTLWGISAADAARLPVETADAVMDWTAVVLAAAGLVVLGLWLWRYGGHKALRRAPVRRHCVPLWLPFAIFFVWFLLFFQLYAMIDAYYGDPQAAEATAARNLMMLALNTAMIAVLLAAGYGLFARRLKGFGLHPKTLGGDAGWAAVNLLAVYPLVFAGVGLSLLIGRLLRGEGFMIETHQSLEELMGFEQVWGRVLVIVLVAAVVPVMEELLFRGLMQTAIRGVTGAAWPAVLLTSALFAVVHSPTHAPAIFALSCGLGYAYEQSGSLWRPILMHVLFNGISVTGSLLMV